MFYLIKEFKKLSFNQKITIGCAAAAIIISIGSLFVSYLAYNRDSTNDSHFLDQGNIANELAKALVKNSDLELETAKKKLSFDIINALYRDFYQFDEKNSVVIRKLKAGMNIEDPDNLALYLNGFEDLYEQCKSGLISKEQVRIHFLYLIGTTCANSQVEQVLGGGGNGLKLLCKNFYPKSQLAKKAKEEKESWCR